MNYDKNATSPKISVLLPVYNGEKYMKEAIESILNQSYVSFELIILDDVSIDKTAEIIKSFKDSRIKYIYFKERMGLVRSLNYGIEISVGKYIARMDADDISVSDRFLKQIRFMEMHPEVGVLGGQVIYIDDNGKITGQRLYPNTDTDVKETMLFRCPFAHPAVMIRKKILSDNKILYNDKFFSCEDEELWSRLMQFTKFYNLNDVILKYRITKESLHMKHLKNLDKIIQYYKEIHGNIFRYFAIDDIKLTYDDFVFLFTKGTEKYPLRKKRQFIKKYKKIEKYISNHEVFYENLGVLWMRIAKPFFFTAPSFKLFVYSIKSSIKLGLRYGGYKILGFVISKLQFLFIK